MFKTKTHNAYIIIMINKESYIKKKSHKDSIRIVITHEDCGNIEIQNNLWYNAINSTNLNLREESYEKTNSAEWLSLCWQNHSW